MTEKKDEYPVAGLHAFLEEATVEFRRFRLQALVNLIGSIVILLFLSRVFIFFFGSYGPPPFEQPGFHMRPPHTPFVPDFLLLVASMGFVLWSVYVWAKQRRFVSRWGDRFEKLEALEKKYLPDENH